MQKSMLEIHVKTSEGRIIIEGPEDTASPEDLMSATIAISPDQVDILIKHLKEARNELLGK
jgi:hypothetical protein